MDALVTPSRTISIGEKQYLLDGSFATLRAVQETFKQDVVRLLVRLMDMRLDEIATIISIGCGQPDKKDEIGQAIVDNDGMMTVEYGRLKTEVFAWLNIAIAPKSSREKKSDEMTAILAKLPTSLGQSTSDTPSVASDGSPANSGVATSGN